MHLSETEAWCILKRSTSEHMSVGKHAREEQPRYFAAISFGVRTVSENRGELAEVLPLDLGLRPSG